MTKPAAWAIACLGAGVLLFASGAGARGGAGDLQAAACVRSTSRSLVLVSASTGAVDRGFPDIGQGGATVAITDGRGGWFVGGGFTCVGTVKAPALVRLRHDGRLDHSWRPALPVDRRTETGYASITTLAVAGKIEPSMNQVAGVAYRFAAFGDIAYLGGNCRNSFSAVAGRPRNNLAALDLRTDRFTSWAPRVAPYTCAPRWLPLATRFSSPATS